MRWRTVALVALAVLVSGATAAYLRFAARRQAYRELEAAYERNVGMHACRTDTGQYLGPIVGVESSEWRGPDDPVSRTRWLYSVHTVETVEDPSDPTQTLESHKTRHLPVEFLTVTKGKCPDGEPDPERDQRRATITENILYRLARLFRGAATQVRSFRTTQSPLSVMLDVGITQDAHRPLAFEAEAAFAQIWRALSAERTPEALGVFARFRVTVTHRERRLIIVCRRKRSRTGRGSTRSISSSSTATSRKRDGRPGGRIPTERRLVHPSEPWAPLGKTGLNG
jgi:hypothetical protein